MRAVAAGLGLLVFLGCDPAPGPEATPWTVGPEPDLVLGAVGGDEALYNVAAALRLPDGRVVIANDGTRELRAYDPTGSLVWTAGREGQGPRDFGRVTDLARRGDTLFVWDNRNGRLTRVSHDGEILGTASFEQPEGRPVSYNRMAGLLGDTAVVLYRYWFPVPGPGPRGTVWDSAPNLLYALDGRLLDTLGFGGIEQAQAPDRSAPPLLWGRRSFHGAKGGRFYTGDGSGTIEAYTGAGLDTVFRLNGGREPVPEEARKAWIDRRLADIPEDWPDAQQAEARGYWRDAIVPALKPAHGHLVVDDVGYLWIQEYRHLREYALPGSRQWTVLGPDGEWITDVVVPDLEVHHIGEAFVLGWRLDELGVEEVVLFPLDRG